MSDPQQYETQYQSSNVGAQNDLQRFFRDDGVNHFDQPIWNGQPNLTGADVNSLLDQGAFGLEWFRRALIRYHRVWDLMKLPGFDSIAVPAITVDGESLGAETINTAADPTGEITRLEGKWYDQQRDLNLGSLSNLAMTISTAADGGGAQPSADDLTTDLTGVANAVPEAWQGSAGDAAQNFLAGFQAHAQQLTQYLQALSAALQPLPDVLLQIVKDKAGFIAGFNTAQCPVAGHAMRLSSTDNDPVSVIITVASDTGTGETDFPDAETQFNKQDDVEDDTADTEMCKQWLTDHFKPAVQEAFTAFVHQCALADHYIRRAYQPVMDLLDNHNVQPFPQPQQPGPDQPPGPAGPAAAPTMAVPTPAAPGEQAAPADAAPMMPAAAADNPLQSLGGLAQQGLAQVQSIAQQGQSFVQQGIEQLQSLAGQGLGMLTGNTSPGLISAAAPAGSKPLADFTVGGEHVGLTQGQDGSVTASLAGPDGNAQQYTLGLRNGLPYLTSGSGSKAPQAPSAPAGPPQPGAIGGGGGAIGGGGGAPDEPEPEAPAPSAGSPVSQQLSESSPDEEMTSPASAQPSGPSSTSPTGMGGMPMGAAAGGREAGDSERRSKSIVPPRPMWQDNAVDTGFLSARPTLDNENRYREVREGWEGTALPDAPAVFSAPDTDRAEPVAVTPPTPPAPARRTDGVKIEIDMGDAK